MLPIVTYLCQVNQLTSWLDASQVYGSDDETADSLRMFTDGLLLLQTTRKGSFLGKTFPSSRAYVSTVKLTTCCPLKSSRRPWSAQPIHLASGQVCVLAPSGSYRQRYFIYTSFILTRRHTKHGEPRAGCCPHDICQGAQKGNF